MHTPDGFLTGWVCVVTLIITLGFVGYSLYSAKRWLTKDKLIMMAGLSAVIFAFQMLNFGIGNGTSGHFIGGALAAIILGPQAAVIVLSSVLLVQTFVYGDGGALAIGANILLMGIVTAYTAHYAYGYLKEKMALGRYPSVILASWGSVLAASALAGLLMGISGSIEFLPVLRAMVITHALIGIGEGLMTACITYYLSVAKERLFTSQSLRMVFRYSALAFVSSVLVLALALPFASQSPDGMEKVAINMGFYDSAVEIYSFAPMPDYTFLGSEQALLVLLGGILGMVLVSGLTYLMSRPMLSSLES